MGGARERRGGTGFVPKRFLANGVNARPVSGRNALRRPAPEGAVVEGAKLCPGNNAGGRVVIAIPARTVSGGQRSSLRHDALVPERVFDEDRLRDPKFVVGNNARLFSKRFIEASVAKSRKSCLACNKSVFDPPKRAELRNEICRSGDGLEGALAK